MVRILTESEVESLLDMRAAVDVVEQALLDQACGKSSNRSRYRIALPRTMLNVMAAGVSTFHALGVKCYVVGQTGPGGAHIYVLLFDSEIGKLLAIMQADKLGQMRTGAASGVATKYLAPEGAKTLGVYGTGWQAESQVEGVAAVRQLARVVVYSRSKRRREDFATRMSERLGFALEPTSAPEEPAAQEIVVTATSSEEPVLRGAWLRPEAHLNATGSNFLFKSELDQDAVCRADFLCIDSREELRTEAGDLLRPLETGLVLPEAVFELGQVVAGQVQGRRDPEDITLFGSHGLALEDMAAARLVFDRAQDRGWGERSIFDGHHGGYSLAA